MQNRQLLPRNETRRIMMGRLRRANQLKALVGPVVSRSASDDTVEVLRIALCLHERLASAARATNEVRETRSRGVRGGDDCFALNRSFVNGAIAEVDQFLRMVDDKLRVITDVPRIGG
jgi:hypothetical protein